MSLLPLLLTLASLGTPLPPHLVRRAEIADRAARINIGYRFYCWGQWLEVVKIERDADRIHFRRAGAAGERTSYSTTRRELARLIGLDRRNR